MIFSRTILCFVVAICLPVLLGAEIGNFQVEVRKDILFAEADGVKLLLNLHLPKDVKDPPLVMFIHGGGWKNGNRNGCKLAWLAIHGYAVASIEYRLSHEALFPAQIHDCKGALRWLRANAGEYGYDSSRVVVGGSSAGGHLALLMGTSGDVAALEGKTGGNTSQSSRVQGIIDFYGPSDFVKRSENQPSKTDHPEGGVYQLLGGPVKERLEAARRASPVFYTSGDDPPLLMLHGTKDRTVFFDQSEIMRDAYLAEKLEVTLHAVPGAGHGWKVKAGDKEQILQFLERIYSLPSRPAKGSTQP